MPSLVHRAQMHAVHGRVTHLETRAAEVEASVHNALTRAAEVESSVGRLHALERALWARWWLVPAVLLDTAVSVGVVAYAVHVWLVPLLW